MSDLNTKCLIYACVTFVTLKIALNLITTNKSYLLDVESE